MNILLEIIQRTLARFDGLRPGAKALPPELWSIVYAYATSTEASMWHEAPQFRHVTPPRTTLACLARRAAAAGDTAVLSWAAARGGAPLLGPDLCVEAAEGGRLDTLAWLARRGCPADGRALRAAARAGRADLVRLFREEFDVPWGKGVLQEALDADSPAVLQYALENGCPSDKKSLHVWPCCHPKICAWARSRARVCGCKLIH